MKEAAHGTGQFAQLSRDDAARKVRDCVAVIMDYKPLAIRSVIPHAPYEEAFKLKIDRQLDHPYVLAFYSIMGAALRRQYSLKQQAQKIDFIFDEQGREVLAVNRVYDLFEKQMLPELKPFLGSPPMHKNDKDNSAIASR